MTCPKCLLRVADEMSLCPACGEDLAAGRATAAGAPSVAPPAPAGEPARKGALPRLIFEAEEPEAPPSQPGTRWPVALLSAGVILGAGAAWAVHGVMGPRHTPVVVVAAAEPAPDPAPEASPLMALDTPLETPAPAPLPTRPAAPSRHAAAPVHARPAAVPHVARRPAPHHPAAAPATISVPTPPPLPAYLSLNATPWGNIFVDDTAMGNTPRLDLALSPGRHHIRITRPGFAAYDEVVDLAAGEHRHLVNITLAPSSP